MASHSHPHPPLMVLVLHLALRLGKSVVMLRLLSGASCAAAAWLTYRWARRTHGQPEALAGLVLLTFSPALVSAACEVRQYALLLLFTCGALHLLQRFLEGKSLWVGGAYSACLYGAVLTHYSAAWIAVLEWKLSEPPRRITALPDLRQSAPASAVTLGRLS